jgi:hypothetical protein
MTLTQVSQGVITGVSLTEPGDLRFSLHGRQLVGPLAFANEQMAEPRRVISMGSCERRRLFTGFCDCGRRSGARGPFFAAGKKRNRTAAAVS